MKSVITHMAFIMLPRQKNVTCKIVSIRVHKVKQKEKEKAVENLNIQRLKGIAFVLFLFANCCIIEGSSPSQNACGSDRSDGPAFYDAATSICCDGNVHPLLINGSEYGCCTRIDINGTEIQELYDKQAQLCCGTHLDPLYDGWYERRCCKGEDEEKFPGEVLEKGQVCCSGRAYILSENQDCCGTIPYDYTKDMCCNDSIKTPKTHFDSPACCGTEPFDEYTHRCDYSVHPPLVTSIYEFKCAEESYDMRTHFCCDETKGPLLKKPVPVTLGDWYNQPREFICCNNTLYDGKEMGCCSAIPAENVVEHPIPAGELCCGNGSVKRDNPLEQCCNGVANRIHSYVPGDPWIPHSCCGTKYVKDGRCCNGKELTPEFACCGGLVEYSRNSALDCCGQDVFDRNHQVCCKKSSAIQVAIDKQRADDTDCCMPGKVPYNRHTHNCTQAVVREKPETRHATIQLCPFCRRKAKPSSYCSARNVYEVTVKRVRFTTKGSVISARMNMDKVKIRIPYRCPACLRQNTEYVIFTNRKVKKGVLRLKAKSTFFKKGDYTLSQVDKDCDLKRKIRRTVKRLARDALKKTIG